MFYDEWLNEARIRQWAANINQRASAPGSISAAQLRGLLLDSAARCAWCGADLRAHHLEVDHLHPLSRGGAHSLANLVVACQDCNRHKADKLPLRFAQEQAARGHRTPLVLRLLAVHGQQALTQRPMFDPPPAPDEAPTDDEPPPYKW